jgi:hypothetical protein
VLPRRIRPAGVRALLGVAALTFEEELHSLAAAQLANGTVVSSHLLLLLVSFDCLGKTGLRAERFVPDRRDDHAGTSC